MAINSKGSEILTVEDTARALRVSVKTVYNLVKRGMLSPHHEIDTTTGRHVMRFRAVDVYAAAASAIEDMDMPKVQNVATRALAMATHAEKSIAAILGLLGIHGEILGFDEAAVQGLYAELQEAVESATPLTEQEGVKWSRVLTQVNEEYLDLMKRLMADPEPWSLLLQVGERLSNDLRDTVSDTAFATRCFLEGARRHFRNTAYFYVRTRNTRNSLPVSSPIDDELLSLMFHH